MPRNQNDDDLSDTQSAPSSPIPASAPLVADLPHADSAVLIGAIERQNEQIEALSRMTAGLADTIAQVRAQTQRDAAFLAAVDSVRAASAAVSSAAMPASAEVTRSAAGQVEDCSGGPCRCTGTDCCCFEIMMVSVRCLAMQSVELADSVANPWSEMEIQMFAYLDDGTGACIPSMFSTLGVRKLVQHPGVPVSVNRLIGTVCLPKGSTKATRITVDAIESDAGLVERATGGRDEEGSASGLMMLDCCCSTEQALAFDLHFTGGGQGGGTIEVRFVARRVC